MGEGISPAARGGCPAKRDLGITCLVPSLGSYPGAGLGALVGGVALGNSRVVADGGIVGVGVAGVGAGSDALVLGGIVSRPGTASLLRQPVSRAVRQPIATHAVTEARIRTKTLLKNGQASVTAVANSS